MEFIWKYTGRGKIAKLYETGAEICVFIEVGNSDDDDKQ